VGLGVCGGGALNLKSEVICSSWTGKRDAVMNEPDGQFIDTVTVAAVSIAATADVLDIMIGSDKYSLS
jgi:hypothetical protein